MSTTKKLACNCGKLAVWSYIPASDIRKNREFCEDCVPRGCSCETEYIEYECFPPKDRSDWIWIEENVSWCYVDELGRKSPCCEFWFDENGWDCTEEDIEYFKSKQIEFKIYEK